MIDFLVIGDGFAASKVASAAASAPGARLAAVAKTRLTPDDAAAPSDGGRAEVVATEFLKTKAGLSWARELNADWLLCINSTVILPVPLIELFDGRALNCHPGLLPEYAGLHAHQWAIRNGESEFGATVHRMEASIDAGPIVVSTRFPIRDDDTGLSLYRRTLAAGSDLLVSLVGRIAAGEQLRFVPQDLFRRHVYRHRDALDGRIDWQWSARSLADFVRAGNYEPFASPTYVPRFDTPSGTIVEILRVEIAGRADQPPGSLIALAQGGPVIACGGGAAVRVTRARSGGRPVTAVQWRRWFGQAICSDDG